MYIEVQFKDKNKVFKGRTYDFQLNREEEIPKEGAIVRLMDSNYNYLFNGTRVKVNKIKEKTNSNIVPQIVRYVEATLD